MLDTVAIRRIRTAARRFAGANEGNIAILFGIAVIPIIGFVGAAVDYTRANSARSSMQAALDSTALMLAKDLTEGTINTSQIPTKAEAYFKALYTNQEAKSVTINASYTQNSGNGSTILVNGSGAIDTGFMRVAGFPTLGFNTSSTSAWGNVRMRVAMALDVTGSMRDDGKMPAMQAAAKSLIDQLSKLAKNNGDMYISIIPFAKDVNLGTSFKDESWIDWDLWSDQNPTWGTCSQATKTSKSSCLDAGKIWTPDKTKWTGCVTDRTQDFDTKNTPPTSSNAPTMVVAEEYVTKRWDGTINEQYCKSSNDPYMPPIMPLSYDWTALKTLIDNLQPTGNTNQGIGMAWAWLTLGVGVPPFNAPAKDTANYAYKDAIVLLSDGLNTQNRWYSNASQIDARQAILCANAKAAPHNITIYTVQVDTGGDGESAVLKGCASSSDKFYRITNASQTLSVFNSIGQSLAKLRVAK
ncbi:TadE/TadG family protein [Bradyrhizobium sp. WSM 1738]|uniref:vWA domain-containing protein n=1 Tax=Bradyrhizobium hereditatis TaxID=2821405 RepID=UPI001CE3ADC2|nr:pilus assembly protein [Bradyrhizobium hereditatis]MCA6117285.1 TadE/TadG family protein [Bradyrhizobium hereditatis]